jgi:hypothetical protein
VIDWAKVAKLHTPNKKTTKEKWSSCGDLVLYPTKKFRIFIKSKKRVILYVLPDKTLFSA